MALDVGEKRVGVAVSDETGTIAMPRDPIMRRELARDLDSVRRLGEAIGIQRIVVGWPLSLNGTVGPQAGRVERFVERLRRVVPWPVELFDERYSSREAERILLEGGVRRDRRRTLIDGLAASVILQTYLDRRRADQERGDPMSEEDRMHGVDGDEDEVITLTDEDGEDHEFVVVDVIEVSAHEYAILLPYEAADEEEAEAVILRIEKTGDGEDQLVEIDDESEWQSVVDAYEAVLDEEGDDGD